MRIFALAIAAASVFGAATIAYAADATGMIASLNMAKDTVTLKNGATYVAPKNIDLATLKPGEKVMVNYAKSGGVMTIMSIKPLA